MYYFFYFYSALSLVTSFTSTGIDFSTVSPSARVIAVSTAVLPIWSGCCATVASIFPAFTAATASSVASNPTTLISFPVAAIASKAQVPSHHYVQIHL